MNGWNTMDQNLDQSSQVSQLEQIRTTLIQDIQQLKSQQTSLTTTIQALEAEVGHAKIRLQTKIDQEEQQLRADIVTLEHKRDIVRDEIQAERKKDALASKKAEAERLSQEAILNDLKKAIRQRQNELDLLQETTKNELQRHKKLANECEIRQTELDRINNDVTSLTKQVNDIKATIEASRVKLEFYDVAIIERQNIAADLNLKITNYEKQFDDLLIGIQEANKELKSVQLQADVVQTDLANRERGLQEREKMLNSRELTIQAQERRVTQYVTRLKL